MRSIKATPNGDNSGVSRRHALMSKAGAPLMLALFCVVAQAASNEAAAPAAVAESAKAAASIEISEAVEAAASGESLGSSEAGAAASASMQDIEEALGGAVSSLNAIATDIGNAEYEKAEAFLIHYIRALQEARHRYHADLVRPLTLLGDAQFGQGDYAGALDSYDTAVHVARVSSGLFSPNQVEAVYKQSEALQRLGDLETAAGREEYAFEIMWKAHGAESKSLLPAIFRLAQWHNRANNIFAARALFEQALKIHTANGQNGTPEAVPALAGLAQTYRQERFPPFYVSERDDTPAISAAARASTLDAPLTINSFPAAERALQEIIRIRQEDPNTGPLAVAEAILDLADWHLLWEHYRKAHLLYEHVYVRLQQIESANASAYFAEPKPLHIPLPRDPKPPPASQRDAESAGFVEVTFRVSPTGGVQAMEVAVSEPPGMMDFPVRRSLRSARYRPAMADGKATSFEGASYRHEFKYFPRLESTDDGDA